MRYLASWKKILDEISFQASNQSNKSLEMLVDSARDSITLVWGLLGAAIFTGLDNCDVPD
ncbi:hypothetical protein QW180_16780 [Vibrio sinaloensis]|nr:hypothetical protein [Vibrio sinaloensis]